MKITKFEEDKFVAKEVEEKVRKGTVCFDDLPKFLKKYIFSFLSHLKHLPPISIVCKSWFVEEFFIVNINFNF